MLRKIYPYTGGEIFSQTRKLAQNKESYQVKNGLSEGRSR